MIKKMNIKDTINIFALTDCHQEARKLCALFSEIIKFAPDKGQGTLICDGGDLFKGIYDRELCVTSYLHLREQLPEAKIVIALGNNDFGFNNDNINFLKQTSARFNRANIHVLCANLQNTETDTYPKWVDPYILLNINNKKVLITAFCINYIHLQKYNLRLINIKDAFLQIKDALKHIAPDAFIILNHALFPSSLELYQTALDCGIKPDLIIGGHEHSPIIPDIEKHIYYPLAFSRNALHFQLNITAAGKSLLLTEDIKPNSQKLNPLFLPDIESFENRAGLNVPVARSTLNLERSYSDPSILGTFIADQMKIAAKADIAMISTGYMTHALRYEPNKVLTMYNIERAFSALTPLQTIELNAAELKIVFNNAIRNRYIQISGNTRFLQCSQNITLYCTKDENRQGMITQILINGEPLYNEDGKPLHPEDLYLCAIDPFIGSGEIGFDVMRSHSKETLLKNQQLVRIKDLFINAIKEAENKYAPGSSYPCFKLIDADI